MPKLEVPPNLMSERLDKAMTLMIDSSRRKVADLIKKGQVKVNQKVEKAAYKVQAGDILDFDLPVPLELDLVAENLPLEVVYQDADLAVINKAQGMVVHPSAGHPSGTLVNALLYHVKDLSTINGTIRPGIVHRIDKDTSGLLMVAKNDQAHESLANQLRNKTSKRQYLALVHGQFSDRKGMIEAPIGRNIKNRKQQAVVQGGKSAVTHFEVLETFGAYSLLGLTLETGRTHQIRVHLAYIGHPVAGDPLYGPKLTLTPNRGQFLHAETLGFKHPRSGKGMEFRSQVPEIFQKHLDQLRQN